MPESGGRLVGNGKDHDPGGLIGRLIWIYITEGDVVVYGRKIAPAITVVQNPLLSPMAVWVTFFEYTI